MRSFAEKPIIVVHDFDIAGAIIHGVWEEGSRRTEHLDLKFENVLDLGLREVDCEELELPKAPEARRYREKNPDAWRVELNALTTLYHSKGIKNPLLWYVAKRMHEEGLNLYEEADKLFNELLRHIRNCFWWSIYPRVTRIINESFEKFHLEDADIIQLKDTKSYYYGYFNGAEFDYLDKSIHEIIWREIFLEAEEADDIAKELLKKAGVDIKNV